MTLINRNRFVDPSQMQGSMDDYLEKELVPQRFVDACVAAQLPVEYHLHEGYNHGYFFVGTFIEHHFKHLLKYIK
jgi:S-formylglutathione hydrolase